jgi:hypothetical protein
MGKQVLLNGLNTIEMILLHATLTYSFQEDNNYVS